MSAHTRLHAASQNIMTAGMPYDIVTDKMARVLVESADCPVRETRLFQEELLPCAAPPCPTAVSSADTWLVLAAAFRPCGRP